MYLKSLVLKGFKSFADRSVLTLEPGITAIVGPNGSGKSNISDAVLWVLGERNARNLRGQAMEDIIFSGSAARKAVSVAEVDLVLDNSDATLPVEFDEVVITRRMFRSGESEYLVNGVVSRRLDVLDILHDTGLGTGTHSIISQGSLDSILQSKPEDRRALIEEAAGVLKHKQRKEKASRKLVAMDAHLDRVRDVAAEVARQLGPLERKAKRAVAYEKARESLDAVRLSLAVDDLRRLQAEWDRACREEERVSGEVEQLRSSVMSAEQRVADLQELIRRESEDAGELARRQRRAANLAERLDSAGMLLRERRRAAVGTEADLRAQMQTSAARRETARKELESARGQLGQIEVDLLAANAKVDELTDLKTEVELRRRAAERESDRLAVETQKCEAAVAEAKRNQVFLKESLSNNLAHVKLVEARKAELDRDLERAQSEYESCSAAASAARAALEDLEDRATKAQADVVTCYGKREEARKLREESEQAVRLVESEIHALEQAQRASREGDPALAWLMDNAESLGGKPLSQTVKVAESLEAIIENMLGLDLTALAVRNAGRAAEIAEEIIAGGLAGSATMLALDDVRRPEEIPARKCPVGQALMDLLSCESDYMGIAEMLFGDVVVCQSREEAFAAHADDRIGLRFISPDGCIIWPNGRVRVFVEGSDDRDGVFARERRLTDLRNRLENAREQCAAAASASDAADESYRSAQAASLKLDQELASAKGATAAAAADEDRASRRLSTVVREMEDMESRIGVARQSVEDLRPELESCEERLQELESQRVELTRDRDEHAALVIPLRRESADFDEKLNEAKLTAATFAERKTYAERIASARERDLEAIDESESESRRTCALKSAAAARGKVALDIVDNLARGLAHRVNLLDDAVSASESSTSSVHADAVQAQDAARSARNGYDEASDRMSQVRIEKSRLEVQVAAAVNTVVVDLGTPIDIAQELPELEDRTVAEDEAFKLERRIKSMGSINPDAAREYADLKERYDYMAGQLADMESARRSLNRIVRVIDARMKDDFVRTFDEVNANFNEIFETLFPGGQASLSLDDPSDLEHSGVEVTAQPRGKRITKMMLMSGGEKSLTALALLFAVYKTRTTPFYILDEVEAALDDTNLRRLGAYIDTLRSTTQLIMITHQRRTMEMADVLFGVSMQSDGITKVVSQKLERALEMAE